MTNTTRNKLTWGNILVILTTLFAAGTAWGVSNVQIQENRQNIEALKVEVAAFEGRLEKQLASIQKENNDMKVMLAEISTDIKWIKDHKDHKEQ